tara:strand:+ start:644 stop:1024 length:381 start_codon:yes stop_codon:yes gene_type:complete
MLFCNAPFSTNPFNDINITSREFYFEVLPSGVETWSAFTAPNNEVTLSASTPAASFSEVSFSQVGLSDLGFLSLREAWSDIANPVYGPATVNTQTWATVSPSGDETWTTISSPENEGWVDISTRII